MLNRIIVEGLFGQYSYDLPLHSADRENICFLTGPNGYGKSTILKLIYALFKADAKTLTDVIFNRISFFMNKYQVVVSQEHSEQDDDVNMDSVNNDEIHETIRLTITVYDAKVERMIESSTFEEGEIDQAEMPLFPPTLTVYLASMNVEYVRDDRLQPQNTDKLGVTQRVELLQEVMSKYDEQLTALYNARLLNVIRENKPAEVKYDEMDDVVLVRRAEEKLTAYNRLGLATKLVVDETANDRYLKLMQITAIDSVLTYDLVYQRLNLLYNIIDKAEFSDKKLVLDVRNGLYFTNGETIIIPEDLSSGEQHFVVQMISFLIKAEPGSLILIDEPELSYHPAWQMDYLKNLQNIVELGKYQIVLATHSPQIFDYHWNYTIDLFRQTTNDAERFEEGH